MDVAVRMVVVVRKLRSIVGEDYSVWEDLTVGIKMSGDARDIYLFD